jgi:hypothetical protein
MSLRDNWVDALASMSIKHIDPTVNIEWTMLGGANDPRLQIKVIGVRDSDDQTKRRDIHVHTMNFCVWPGMVVARAFLACAWASYFQHEALELCSVDGVRIWDPHRPPYIWDQGFRGAMPVDVTSETIAQTLGIVMGGEAARRLMGMP